MNQSLMQQHEALVSLLQSLNQFVDDLKNQLDRYHNLVENLKENGLSNEVYSTYMSSYFQLDRQHIDRLVQHIESADIPYIQRNLGTSEENKSAATTTSGIDW